jgi:hypothetical protein
LGQEKNRDVSRKYISKRRLRLWEIMEKIRIAQALLAKKVFSQQIVKIERR